MSRYIIEREIAGVGALSPEQLCDISRKSREVLRGMGAGIQWEHTYVADDKVYCVYIADNEDLIREHARRGGFPADKIMQVRAVIDPTTAETQSIEDAVMV